MLHHQHRIKGTPASDSSRHLSNPLNQLFSDGGRGGEALCLHFLKTLLVPLWFYDILCRDSLLAWLQSFRKLLLSKCFCSLATTGSAIWHFICATKEETVALPQRDVHLGGIRSSDLFQSTVGCWWGHFDIILLCNFYFSLAVNLCSPVLLNCWIFQSFVDTKLWREFERK